MSDFKILRLLLAGLLALGTGGCRIAVNSLSEGFVSPPPLAELPPVTLRVERLTHAEGKSTRYPPALEDGLVEALRAARLFAAVYSPDTMAPEAATADLILRGEILTEWGSQGAANFFTYFPGGLIFAPNWRGTRWDYQAMVNLEIVDVASEEIIGSYVVESNHQLVHRSGNPMHFLFAAMVIPATVIGSGKSWVRANYRKSVHDKAYPDLWQRVAAQISNDRGPASIAALSALRERCGERYDEAPTIGNAWATFRDCQPGYYRKLGEQQTSSGTAEVFEDIAGHWRIYVVDGQISQWNGGEADTQFNRRFPPHR
jgi:hypothetical protein